MNKGITIGFGVLFGLIGVVSIIGVLLGYTHLLIIGSMSFIIVVFSYREFKNK